MFSKLVSFQIITGYNIIYNTQDINYLTKCILTTRNATYFITYQEKRKLQNWKPKQMCN